MAAFLVAAAASPQPNIFVLLTDDQDDLLNSTIVQPNLLSRVGGQGVRFANGFVNHPVCCVSRSSLLTGRYSHNTHVLNNSAVTGDQPRGNCTSPAWAANLEPRALAADGHFALRHRWRRRARPQRLSFKRRVLVLGFVDGRDVVLPRVR